MEASLFRFPTLFLIAAGVVVYESYTGHFRLDRMTRSATLLDQLQKQQEALTKSPSPPLAKIHDSISGELQAYVNGDRMPFHIAVWALKALAASVPWVIACVVLIITNTGGLKNMLAGFIMLATPMIFIGAILPDFRYTWINYLCYPIVSSLAVMIFMWWLGTRKKTKKGEQGAAGATATSPSVIDV